MRRRQTPTRLALLLTLALVTQAKMCDTGTIKSFRLALAASGPLVNSLVGAGVIPQAKATAIITDFNDAATCGLTLQEAFAAIPSELPAGEKKSRKYEASLAALQCFRVIMNRQNFGAHSRIQTVANIAEGILASLVMFYSDGSSRASIGSPQHIVTANTEKELEEGLKRRVKELKLAMQP